jgi:hypothetical protein
MTNVKTRTVSEVLAEVSKIRTRQGRIDSLRANDSPLLRDIIRLAYHPNYIWLLPRGIPPYTPNPIPFDAFGILTKEEERLRYFIFGMSPNQNTMLQVKREKMFIDLLEMIHPEDARLLCAIKDKKINYPFLTYTLCQEAFAFTDLLPQRGPTSWLEEDDRKKADDLQES